MTAPARAVTVLVAATTLALALAAAPAGAVTIGSKCVTNSGGPITLFTTGTSSGESYVVPFDGIVTSWGFDRTAADADPGMVAAVFGSASGSKWTIAASSGFRYTRHSTGAVSFPSRFAVLAGQTLGSTIYSATAVSCETGQPADTGSYGNAYGVGEYTIASALTGYKAAIWAEVERDVDNDGFGDDTQDKCPQSAAYQNPCPALAIVQQLSATAKQINILATASVDTSLTAVAVVSIPKIGKTKAKRVTIQGAAQPFQAGAPKTISLKLPASVKSALKKKKLSATVTLSGNGIANKATITAKVGLKK